MRLALFVIFALLASEAYGAACSATDTTGGDTRVFQPCTKNDLPSQSTNVNAAVDVWGPYHISGCGSGSQSPAWTATLPTGLAIDSQTGRITGNPTATGSTNATLRCTNNIGFEEIAFTWTVSSGETPVNKSSGNITGTLTASRTTCISPCPIIFDIHQIDDDSASVPWLEMATRFEFGDGTENQFYQYGKAAYETGEALDGTGEDGGHDGASKGTAANVPIVQHMFTCDAGTCNYNVGATVIAPDGDWATFWIPVTVQSQEDAFPGANTVCISTSSTWTGDTPCPSGAVQQTDMPTLGNWQDNTRYMFRRGESWDPSDNCMEFDSTTILLTPFGNDADAKPEFLDGFTFGMDSACNDSTPSDAAVAGYSNPNMLENLTMVGIRLPSVSKSITWNHISLIDLDMDYEDVPGEGSIGTNATNYCVNNSELSCSNVPLPIGTLIEDVRIVGSSSTLVNIGYFNNTSINYFGFNNGYIRRADEHNIRLEGGTKLVVSNSHVNGEHIGGSGAKHAVTFRCEGYFNQDGYGQYRVNSSDKADIYNSRHTGVFNNYFGTPGVIGQTSARVTITPTNNSEACLTMFGIVGNNKFDVGTSKAVRDVGLAGADLGCRDDNDYEANQTCDDDRNNSGSGIPGGDNEAQTTLAVPAVPPLPSTY